MTTRTNRSAAQIRAAFARVFVVLYVIASLFAVLHQDNRAESSAGLAHTTSCGGARSGIRQNAASSGHFQANANADLISASDNYCALCDFIGHMVSAASVPQIAHQLHAVLAFVAAPPVRPQPYAPFRFYARSASRAPPTA